MADTVTPARRVTPACMRRLARPLLCGLSGAALMLASEAASAADGAVRDTPRQFTAEYLVTWLGLPVYRARFTARIGAGRYQSAVSARSLGVVELAARIRVSFRATGRIAGDSFRPESVRQIYLLKRGQFRHVDMDYRRDGHVSTVTRPPESPGKRRPVPPALSRYTQDPLSALLGAVTLPTDAAPCVHTASVYEGRRRVDTRLTFERRAPTPAVPVAGLPEQAMVCQLHANRIAGFSPKHFRMMPKLPPARLWVVRSRDAAIWLPVQLELETRWGPVYGRLVRFAPDRATPTR